MNNTVEEGKTTAIVAYLTIIGAVTAIFMNQDKKNEFASFHIRQALGIFLSFFLLSYFVGNIDSWTASVAFYIFYFVLWMYGFLGMLQGKMNLIPVLGQYFQKFFKSV
ncbi:hypothetical protein [Flavobacterium sp.]|uniref:hypothetical protein n=1 Tax=Flavobacterium sp. TaxID=239 RepID=UPI0039E22825